jgi:hypothetical protein
MIKLIDLLNEIKINKPGKYIIPVPNNPGNANWPSELGIDSGYYIRPTTYKNFKETIKNDFNVWIKFYLEEFEDDDDINVEDYTDDQLLDIIINKFSYVMFNTEEEVEDYFELLDYVDINMGMDVEEEEQQIFNSIDSADDTIWKIWPKPQFLNTLNEYKINKPGKIEIPSGWDEDDDYDDEPDEDGYITIIRFYVPYEGWDPDDKDIVYIRKTPKGTFEVSTSDSFTYEHYDREEYPSLYAAKTAAVEAMKSIKRSYTDRDEEDNDDELNEYEIKKPTLFNTDSSKGKLWVDYNPKLRKIDGKELSLLNRVYSALKPVENRLDDSLRLSPSLDRVMMKYGYWEWIEDREILKALKDFNVEIEDDYDDDRGQTTYYMVKDK